MLDGFALHQRLASWSAGRRLPADPKAALKIEIGFWTEDADLNEMVEGAKTREIIRRDCSRTGVTPSADILPDSCPGPVVSKGGE
ncbi:hypothetical protein [Shinella zoogloeoides]|uniref:hypothetical protein n=1 Tax=Shinella zoogloeoides TaxID=352475 RepID=UPI00299CE4A0|nr:hypothetical protein [Shinella zoogloeoides]WPE24145.1 hypothetical protein ShzoTeo12_53650 [Shinella zoogloeoides]